MIEKALAHLSETLQQAEQTRGASAAGSSIRSVDPRVKVIGAALITIAVVASSRVLVVAVVLLMLTVFALFSQISWKRLLATWASGIFFAVLIAIPAFFAASPKLGVLLIVRSEASLTCWLLVIMTTPFSRVLRALRLLHVPAVFVAILSMTFRYIFLLVETAQDMLLSRRSRIVARMSGADNRRILASTTGVLLSKSVQMSDEVYQAMSSRGFRGEIHLLEDFQMRSSDWVLLAALIATAIGIFVSGRS